MASEKHPRYLHSSQVIKRHSLRSYSSQEQSLQIVKFKEEQRDKIQGDLEKARKKYDTLAMSINWEQKVLSQKTMALEGDFTKLETLNQKRHQNSSSQIHLKFELKSLQKKIESARDEYERAMLQEQVRDASQKLALQAMIQKRVLEQIQSTKKSIWRKEEQIKEKEKMIQRKEEQIKDKQEQIRKKEESIREIEQFLKKQEERLDELRKKTMKLESSPVFFPPIGKRKVQQRMPKRM